MFLKKVAAVSLCLLLVGCAEEPSKYQDPSANKAQGKVYWESAAGLAALAIRDHAAAGVAAQSDDMVKVVESFKSAKKRSDLCFRVAGGTIHENEGADLSMPPGWEGVRDALQEGAMHLEKASELGVEVADNGKPSDAADYRSEYAQAVKLLNSAVAEARSKYESMGGNGADIDDFDFSAL